MLRQRSVPSDCDLGGKVKGGSPGEAEGRLTKRIADAVAGGLTLESWGLSSFILGLILQATGGALQ